MARKTPSRPTLRPTSPDVANALRSLDAEQPAVITTPVRATEPAYPGEPGSLADIGRKRFQKEQSERLGADAPKPKVPAPPEPIRTTANLSVSIATAMRDRIDALAYEQKLGKTAIVEGALSALFEGRSNEQIAKLLKDKGHGFRRRS